MDQEPGDGGRDPWHIHLPDHQPFSFSGLWAYNSKLDVTSCTILTAAAVDPVSQIHDRMPVIVDPAAYDAWLDPDTPVPEAQRLLLRNLAPELQFYRVGRQVNSSKYEGGPDCIEPVNPL